MLVLQRSQRRCSQSEKRRKLTGGAVIRPGPAEAKRAVSTWAGAAGAKAEAPAARAKSAVATNFILSVVVLDLC